MLLEKDSGLLGIIWIEHNVKPVGGGGGREIENYTDLRTELNVNEGA